MPRDDFVDSKLVKIRDRLAGASEDKKQGDEKAVFSKDASNISGYYDKKNREWTTALLRRWDEFRLTRKDVTGRLSEKIASIPEEIKISETYIEELRDALEKFAGLLDGLEAIDDSKWNKNNFASDLGVAMKKLENTRLELLRLSAKLAALQRESNAVEADSGKTFLLELTSLSLSQGFRLGVIFLLPLILGLLATAFILAIAILVSLRVNI